MHVKISEAERAHAVHVANEELQISTFKDRIANNAKIGVGAHEQIQVLAGQLHPSDKIEHLLREASNRRVGLLLKSDAAVPSDKSKLTNAQRVEYCSFVLKSLTRDSNALLAILGQLNHCRLFGVIR